MIKFFILLSLILFQSCMDLALDPIKNEPEGRTQTKASNSNLVEVAEVLNSISELDCIYKSMKNNIYYDLSAKTFYTCKKTTKYPNGEFIKIKSTSDLITGDTGETGETGVQGDKGHKGNGISGYTKNESGEFIFTLNDGQTINAGAMPSTLSFQFSEDTIVSNGAHPQPLIEITEAKIGDVVKVYTDSGCETLFQTSDAATSTSLALRLSSLGWEEKTFNFYYRKNDGACTGTKLSYSFKPEPFHISWDTRSDTDYYSPTDFDGEYTLTLHTDCTTFTCDFTITWWDGVTTQSQPGVNEYSHTAARKNTQYDELKINGKFPVLSKIDWPSSFTPPIEIQSLGATGIEQLKFEQWNITNYDWGYSDISRVTSFDLLFNMACIPSEMSVNDNQWFNTENVITARGALLELNQFCTNVNWDSAFKGSFSFGKGMNFKKLKDITGITIGLAGIDSLDFSYFDTNNVEIFDFAFSYNPFIKYENIILGGKFSTKSAKSMAGMFKYNPYIKNIDLSNFETSNVLNMSGMFANTSGLEQLDLTNFDTSNVIDMSGMFQDSCNLCEILDVSHFNTSKVKNFFGMFYSGVSVNLGFWEVENALSSIQDSDLFTINNLPEQLEPWIGWPANNIPGFSSINSLINANGKESMLLSFDLTGVGQFGDNEGQKLYCENVLITTPQGTYTCHTLFNNQGLKFSSDTTISHGAHPQPMIVATNILTNDQYKIYDDSACSNLIFTSETASEDGVDLEMRLPSLGWEEKTFNFYYRKNDGACTGTKLSYSFKPEPFHISWSTSPYYIGPEDDLFESTYTYKFYSDCTNKTCDFEITWWDGTKESSVPNVNVYTHTAPKSGERDHLLISGLLPEFQHCFYTGSGCDGTLINGTPNFDGNLVYFEYSGGPFTSPEINIDSLGSTGLEGVLMFPGWNISEINWGYSDISRVTSLESAFASACIPEIVEVKNNEWFNTENITTTKFMFIDLYTACDKYGGDNNLTFGKGMNFTKLRSTEGMFLLNIGLKQLNLSNFNTSSVENFAEMFRNMNAQTIDLKGLFDTSSATSFRAMFQYNYSLTKLDLSNFITTNVIDMSEMFSGTPSLTELNISTFDTSKVENMALMFHDTCLSCSSFDLSHFDTTNVRNFYDFLQFTNKSQIINLGYWELDSVVTSLTESEWPQLFYYNWQGFSIPRDDLIGTNGLTNFLSSEITSGTDDSGNPILFCENGTITTPQGTYTCHPLP